MNVRYLKINENTSIRLDYYFLYALIALPYFLPYLVTNSMNSSSIGHSLLVGLIDLSIGLMLFHCLFHFKNGWPQILLSIISIILVISSYLVNGNYSYSINFSLKCILATYTISGVLRDEERTVTFLQVIRDISFVFFFVNFLCEAYYPHGIPSITPSYMFPYYVYGNVNVTMRSIIPGFCCSCIYDYKKYNKLSWISLFFFFGMIFHCATAYISATAIVGLLIIAAWLFFNKQIKQKLGVVFFAATIIVLYLELVLIVFSSNAALSDFITNLFGKSSDFSGRARYWVNILDLISEKPLFGYGIQYADVLKSEIGNSNGSHNYYLDFIYRRGYVGGIVFLAIIVLQVYYCKKNKDLSMSSYILLGFCLSLYFMFLFEPFTDVEITILPLIATTVMVEMKNHEDVRSK